MLLITCPNCGAACAETELHPGGQAHLKRFGSGSSDTEFAGYMFERKNPKGVHFERWRHAFGCGKWFHVARCTQSLQVFGSYSARTTEPPQELVERIREARADWRPEGAL